MAYFSVPSSALKKFFFQINFYRSIVTLQDFPGGSVVKNPPAKKEMWVRSLGWEDPLERKWQLTPVFFPGKFREQRSLPGRPQSMQLQKSQDTN